MPRGVLAVADTRQGVVLAQAATATASHDILRTSIALAWRMGVCGVPASD